VRCRGSPYFCYHDSFYHSRHSGVLRLVPLKLSNVAVAAVSHVDSATATATAAAVGEAQEAFILVLRRSLAKPLQHCAHGVLHVTRWHGTHFRKSPDM
jgi:hypothetical protein